MVLCSDHLVKGCPTLMKVTFLLLLQMNQTGMCTRERGEEEGGKKREDKGVEGERKRGEWKGGEWKGGEWKGVKRSGPKNVFN